MMEEANAVLIVLSLGGLGLAYGLYYIISVYHFISLYSNIGVFYYPERNFKR